MSLLPQGRQQSKPLWLRLPKQERTGQPGLHLTIFRLFWKYGIKENQDRRGVGGFRRAFQ